MVVPPKGGEVQQRMFFLFSDILLATKPCHPLHPWNSHKFACQAVYPLSQCTLTKVFGHTQRQGGLLSVSVPSCRIFLYCLFEVLLLSALSLVLSSRGYEEQTGWNMWRQNWITEEGGRTRGQPVQV